MVFEHLALNVNNVAAVVKWYVSHLQLKVVRQQKELPFDIYSRRFRQSDSGALSKA